MIKHVWFDFSETIAALKKEAHDQLRYNTYAAIVNKSVTPDLIREYEELYEKYNHSNSAIFHSLGLSARHWSDQVNSIPPEELYSLAAENIPAILKKLKSIIPISLFSNIKLGSVLPALGIQPAWFTNIVSGEMIKNPKPALDGFYKIIELSHLPPEEILYVGDHVGKDVLPAKKVGIKAGLMWGESLKADYSFEGFGDVLALMVKQLPNGN